MAKKKTVMKINEKNKTTSRQVLKRDSGEITADKHVDTELEQWEKELFNDNIFKMYSKSDVHFAFFSCLICWSVDLVLLTVIILVFLKTMI